jgi:hypothetical protein
VSPGSPAMTHRKTDPGRPLGLTGHDLPLGLDLIVSLSQFGFSLSRSLSLVERNERTRKKKEEPRRKKKKRRWACKWGKKENEEKEGKERGMWVGLVRGVWTRMNLSISLNREGIFVFFTFLQNVKR